MNYRQELIDIIKNISKSFSENELAYLALTSKIEIPLRDKIAYVLHKKYNKHSLVCREWKNKDGSMNSHRRIDLAIIDRKSKKATCLIEFKANSSGVFEKMFEDEFEKDKNKMNEMSNSAEKYYVFFCNDHDNEISKDFSHSIKYLEKINKSKNRNMIGKWREKLNKKDEVFPIDAGSYYNIKVEIVAFIHKIS